MHGAPAVFLGRDLGGTVRSAKGTDGHGRGRSRARRVPAGRWRDVVSVVPGRGVGPVGFRAVTPCSRVGRAGAAAPVSVPRVCGDPCVAAGDVAAAQGLCRGVDLGGGGGQGGRCRAPPDRASVGDSRIDGPRLAAGDHRASAGGAALVHLGRGRCGGRRGDTEGGGVGVRGCAGRGRRGAGGDRGAFRGWVADRCGDVGAGRCCVQRCSAAVTGLAGTADTGSPNTSWP